MQRRWVAFLLAFSMLGGQAFLANTTDQSLEAVILKVKDTVEIPDKEFTNFEYSSSDTGYQLYWRDNERDKFVSVSCEKDGDIVAYTTTLEPEERQSQLAKVSRLEAQKKAEAFLKQVAPKYAEQLVLQNSGEPDSGYAYRFSYTFQQEGITVFGKRVWVSINKQTGRVTNFEGLREFDEAIYAPCEPKLNLEQAQQHYLTELGLTMYYEFYNEGDSTKAFLAYEPDWSNNKAIDAQSGKVVEYMPSRFYEGYDNGVTGDKAESASGLTEEEQEAVDGDKACLSAETLKEKTSDYFPLLKPLKLDGTRLYKRNQEYKRNMDFVDVVDSEASVHASLSCNAVTGELISYRYYDERIRDYTDKKQSGTEAQASDLFALIQKVNPEKSQSVTLNQNTSDEGTLLQYVTYIRQYEGVPVKRDGIFINYHKELKQPVQYRVVWTDDVVFPKHEGVLSEAEIVKKLGLKLYYMKTDQQYYSLVYNYENNTYAGLYDAFTGNKVDWRGESIEEVTNRPYTDIKGHEAESIITQLYDSGIYLEGAQLKPNEAITQKDLSTLLMRANIGGAIINPYEYRLDQVAPQDAAGLGENKKLTRGEGVKLIIETMGYDNLAKQPSLFQYPFEEAKIDKDLKGYITIAYGLGLLPNIKKYEPTKPLTKADAMVMIYYMLMNKDTN